MEKTNSFYNSFIYSFIKEQSFYSNKMILDKLCLPVVSKQVFLDLALLQDTDTIHMQIISWVRENNAKPILWWIVEEIVKGLPLNQECHHCHFYDISNQTPSPIINTRLTEYFSFLEEKVCLVCVRFGESIYGDTSKCFISHIKSRLILYVVGKSAIAE